MPKLIMETLPLLVPSTVAFKTTTEDGKHVGHSGNIPLADLPPLVLSDLCTDFRVDVFKFAQKRDPVRAPVVECRRKWINQPSKHQDHNDYHGTNVLALYVDNVLQRIYFLQGAGVSMFVKELALEDGWI